VSLRHWVFVGCALAIGCGGPDPALCDEIVEACHDVDDGSDPDIHECHEGADAGDPKVCEDTHDDCVALCEAAATTPT
jgi:hypothetical protein